MSRVTRLQNKRETLSPSKFLRAYGAEPGLIKPILEFNLLNGKWSNF